MTDMKPKDAIKQDIVQLDKSEAYPKEVVPEDDLCRSLYQSGEQHGDQKRRANDFSWSKNTCRLDRIVEDLDNLVLYYLQGLKQKDAALALLSNELQEQAIQ